MIVRSRAYLLNSSDIDTDRIFPSRFHALVDGSRDLSDCFFHDERFGADGAPLARAVLNDPALQGAQIIVAPSNYACGSARAGAIFAHVNFGIRLLVSESFGSVFPTVSYKYGLIAIELPKPGIGRLIAALEDDPATGLEVDLEAQEVRLPGGVVLPFELDDFVRYIALSGKDEIGFTNSFQPEIDAFEARRREEMPWLFG